VYFWMNGQRMLHGETIYKDFFQFTPPGTSLVFFALFKLFGPRIWVTNAVVLVLGVALSYACFRIATKITKISLAVLATSLFAVCIYGELLNATHHWFSVLAVMCAVSLLLNERSRGRIAVAGILLGLACFFTQTHGAVATLALMAFLLWERYVDKAGCADLVGKQFVLSLAFSATLIGIYWNYIANDGISALWYFQVTHVRKYLIFGLNAPSFGLPTWRSLPSLALSVAVYGLLPVIYALTLARSWHRGSHDVSAQGKQVCLLSTFGSLFLLETLFSINWLRIYAIALPGVVLLIWNVGRTIAIQRYAVWLLWIGVCLLGIKQIWSTNLHNTPIQALSGGAAATSPARDEKLRWVAVHTNPGEYFFEVAWPGMYIPLGLRNPVFLDVLSTFEETRPEYIERAIQELAAKRVRFIVWSPRLDKPGSSDRATHQIEPVRSFLRDNYRRTHVFADQDEVWERE
jgi:hypothetical protein